MSKNKPTVEQEAEDNSLSAPPPELREASFQIPYNTPQGVNIDADALHKQVMMLLSHRFGGCHSCPVLGAWRHGEVAEHGEVGMIMVEAMLKVTCALRTEDQSDFRDIAMSSARVFKQEALYWVDRAGVVHIEPVILEGRLH